MLKMLNPVAFKLLVLLVLTYTFTPEEDPRMSYADRYETCDFLATVIEERLKQKGHSHDIQIAYFMDDEMVKKRTEYRRSELHLLDAMENVCDRIFEYNLHTAQADSIRFSKRISEAFQKLQKLVENGVNVELGIPEELWDKATVEVIQMKSNCEEMLEKYEDYIYEWYFTEPDGKSLKTYLCDERVVTEGEGNNQQNSTEKQQHEQKEKEKANKTFNGIKTEL